MQLPRRRALSADSCSSRNGGVRAESAIFLASRDFPKALDLPTIGIMNHPRVVSIYVGKVAPLGPEGVPSAFVKQPVQGPVKVTLLGLEGDVHRIGSSRLQVCQPRQPCFKLALRFDDKFMPKAMIRTGRAGWYYRVLEPGVIATGDTVQLEDRPNPDFQFARLIELISQGKATHAELERLQNMQGLASDWQLRARAILARLPESLIEPR
jgi:MOSC domain-containing protein YiiM